MMNLRMIVAAVLVVVCLGCHVDNTDPGNTEPNVTDLFGAYLGQEPPGAVPVRFAQGTLLSTESWWWISPPKFSPDGLEMFHTRYIVGNPDTKHVYVMERGEGDRWTSPQRVPFDGESGDCHVAFSIDGSKLFFLSHRPGGPFFVLHRLADGWSAPESLHISVTLPVGNQFSVTRDETIYFEMSNGNADDICRSRLVNGQYGGPEYLGAAINTNDYEEYAPFIEPNEAYLIFASNRPGGYGGNDLYISFRNPDGSWTEPRNMGASINSDTGDTLPVVSPDGNYFFFITARPGDRGFNPYWVDADIIDTYRN